MITFESKNGERLHLEHLGADIRSFSMTQRHDGTVFEMAGDTLGGTDFSEKALRLMMGSGFSAGDEVQWKDDKQGGESVTVTILQWEYHPAITTTTFGMDGKQNGFERTPHEWKLWVRQEPTDTDGGNPPRPPLGFLRPNG